MNYWIKPVGEPFTKKFTIDSDDMLPMCDASRTYVGVVFEDDTSSDPERFTMITGIEASRSTTGKPTTITITALAMREIESAWRDWRKAYTVKPIPKSWRRLAFGSKDSALK